MKSAADAILRTEQAAYLDDLHTTGMAALAVLGSTSPAGGPVGARDVLLTRMEAHAADRGYPISDPEVALLLSILARAAQPKVIVELGTNIGYGAIVLARAAGPGARVITIEARSELVGQARGFIEQAGLGHRIDVRHGEAIAELEKIEDPIDLLYVDCVKEEYPAYLAIAKPKLAARGIIVADNVLWRGQVALDEPLESEKKRAACLREFNQALVSGTELCGVVLPLGDGVGLATKI
ncbi:MAG TPA: O-methyltransferase [Polyangiaceae bacterium]|nr:O-methyltransferase [Polyangiaceae bacterium]